MKAKIKDIRCPFCKRLTLFVTKLKTRKNYPFGKYKTGWKNGKKIIISKKKAMVSLVYKRIECLSSNKDGKRNCFFIREKFR